MRLYQLPRLTQGLKIEYLRPASNPILDFFYTHQFLFFYLFRALLR